MTVRRLFLCDCAGDVGERFVAIIPAGNWSPPVGTACSLLMRPPPFDRPQQNGDYTGLAGRVPGHRAPHLDVVAIVGAEKIRAYE